MRVKEEIERLKTLPPDEPIFILRAQDMLAAQTVRYWCGLARANDVPPAKVGEAMGWADAMEMWPVDKLPD